MLGWRFEAFSHITMQICLFNTGSSGTIMNKWLCSHCQQKKIVAKGLTLPVLLFKAKKMYPGKWFLKKMRRSPEKYFKNCLLSLYWILNTCVIIKEIVCIITLNRLSIWTILWLITDYFVTILWRFSKDSLRFVINLDRVLTTWL